MSRKPLILDLSEVAGMNSVPLHLKGPKGVLKFSIPERTDHDRALMVGQLERCDSDQASQALVADWLLTCATQPMTREDILPLLARPAALAQVLTVVITGTLPNPKQMDQLLARLLDKLTGDLIDGVISGASMPSSPPSSPAPDHPRT